MKLNKLISFAALLPISVATSGCADRVSPKHQRKFFDEEEKITLREVTHLGEGMCNPAPTTGNTRVLVIPIEFTDYPADEIGKYYNAETAGSVAVKHTADAATHGRGAEEAITDIEHTYFGNPEDTTWHSLASYYRSASYGKLNFNGVVVPWWTKAYVNSETLTPVTTVEFADGGGTARGLCNQIVDDIAENKYFMFHGEDGNAFTSKREFLQYFDSDHDGYIDLVEMVYSAPFQCDKGTSSLTQEQFNDIFWAYCGVTSNKENPTNPKLGKWAWQSYYTMVEGGKQVGNDWRLWTCQEIADGDAKVDAHTIIHETGHGLGLPDYYNTDGRQDGVTSGCVDMMAYNVGDHNSHSKSLLGWVNPTVVTGPTEVELKSFTKTGDCIYLPYRGYYDDGNEIDKKYKNTFSTEYIAIELMTPTGVNELDSTHSYMNSYPQVPTIPGIKIYHVDSRIAIKDYSVYPYKFVSYTTSIVNVSGTNFVTYAHTNSPSTTVKKSDGSGYCFQLQYLYKNIGAGCITNDSLYQQGDVVFSGDLYGDFVMNSGKKLGYKVTIKSLSYDPNNLEDATAVIRIEAKKK